MPYSSLAYRILKEHIAPYKFSFMIAIFYMVIAALTTAALPFLIKPFFDDVFNFHKNFHLLTFCGCIMVIFFLKGFSSYQENVRMCEIGQNIIADLQKRLFSYLVKTDLSFFHQHTTGELLSRFTNDIQLMRTAVTHTITGVGRDFMSLIFLVILMFYRDWILALGASIVFPLAFKPITRIGKKVRKVTTKTQDDWAILTSRLSQIFYGIRIVKAYNCEEHEKSVVGKMIDQLVALSIRTTKARSLGSPIIEALAGIVIAAIIAYGGWQVMLGNRTPGDFMSFITALIIAYEPLKRLSNLNANLQEGLAAAKRVFEIIDTPSFIEQKSTNASTTTDTPNIFKNKPDPFTTLSFDNVSFAYPNKQNVLNHVSLTIKAGDMVAFVGSSGAGKSTLVNLVPRFHDVTHGNILINDVDIRTLPLPTLRHQIALVSQEIILFDQSIKENIRYGSFNASDEEIIEAAKAAAAHEFIIGLEESYNTIIGENGLNLSGGQRQRLALARAFLRKAPIIILDEATSALDSHSEKIIQNILLQNRSNKTYIIIAHRLSTIMDADCIYVLEQGNIVEHGSHEELLKKEGFYYRLWHRQQKDNRF